MRMVKVCDIVITDLFKETKPKESKINKAKKYFLENGKFDKPIVINKNNVLQDGYSRYLVAVELGVDYIDCTTVKGYVRKNNEQKYIIGKFDGNDKEYCWKADERYISVGDRVVVNTNTLSNDEETVESEVTVTKVFRSNNKKYNRHKTIVRILNKKQ